MGGASGPIRPRARTRAAVALLPLPLLSLPLRQRRRGEAPRLLPSWFGRLHQQPAATLPVAAPGNEQQHACLPAAGAAALVQDAAELNGISLLVTIEVGRKWQLEARWGSAAGSAEIRHGRCNDGTVESVTTIG